MMKDILNSAGGQRLKIDLEAARRHLSFLDPSAQSFVFQTFDDRGDDRSLTRIINGSLDQCAGQLIDLNRRGAGIFVCINRSKNGGRKKADITSCRVVFREGDTPDLPDLPLHPHLVIETSPGKRHEYLLTEDSGNFELWDAVMKTMVLQFGSDKNARDRSRVLRLTGFFHNKKDPHMVRIIALNTSPRYTLKQIAEHIPPYQEPEATSQSPLDTCAPRRYGEQALANEIATLVGTAKGNRNHRLNRAAFSLGQLIAGGEIDRAQVEAALLSAAISVGLRDTESKNTIQSGLTAGMAKPRSAPVVDRRPTAPDERRGRIEGLDSNFIQECLHANEDGDARLYKELTSDQFVYDHSSDEWFAWQGHYWKLDILNNSMGAIEGVIAQYDKESKRQFDQSREATKAGDKEKSQDHAAVAGRLNARILKLQTVQRKRNVLFLAAVGNGLTGTEWDQAAGLLPCVNGIVNLRTGELRPGVQEDFIKTVTPTAWKGIDAPCPVWEKFVEDIFDGDSDLISYAQRVIGYSLLGNPVEHIMVILFGEGRNGKGTFLETIQAVLGPDGLAYETESSLLLKDYLPRNSGAPNTSILSLRGKRIVFASETNEEARLDSSKVKELTGGDTLNARGIRAKHHVTFAPTHVLFLMTNTKPTAPGNDFALWKRLHLVPFNVKFVRNPTEKNQRTIDMHLPKKLLDEASGILAWMARGAMKYCEEGLIPPEVVLQAIFKYKQEQDIIGLFINERCVTGEGFQVSKGELHKAYVSFCNEENFRPLSGIKFWRQMDIRGFDSYENSGARKKYFLNIGLSEKRTS